MSKGAKARAKMPEKAKRTRKIKERGSEPHPLSHLVGKLVRYYSDGWYHGYLESLDGDTATIRPISKREGVRNTDVHISCLIEIK
jgi:hypothetical protein